MTLFFFVVYFFWFLRRIDIFNYGFFVIFNNSGFKVISKLFIHL